MSFCHYVSFHFSSVSLKYILKVCSFSTNEIFKKWNSMKSLMDFSLFKRKPTQFKFHAHFTCAKALLSVFPDFKTCNIFTVPSLNSSLLLHVL